MQRGLLSETKKIKTWTGRNNVIDVILFGSFMRGKSRPKDIDLCIIVKDRDEKKSLDLIHSLGKLTDRFNQRFHINLVTQNAFMSGNTLTKTLLKEGFSIKHNRKLSSVFGFESKSLLVYSLKNFTASKRVMFHYLLKGRYGSKGILTEVKGRLLGTGTIIVPSENEDLLKEIFDKWGVNYKQISVLVG